MRQLAQLWLYSWFFFAIFALVGLGSATYPVRLSAWRVKGWEWVASHAPFLLLAVVLVNHRGPAASPSAVLVCGVALGVIEMIFMLLLRGQRAKLLPASVSPFVPLAASTASAALVAVYLPSMMR